MKRTGRILALVLALAMLFSVTVFADWTVYGGNDNHNSVVTEAPHQHIPHSEGNQPFELRLRLGRR